MASLPPIPRLPSPGPNRLPSLDLLRGIAICGIALVNLLDFAGLESRLYSATGLGPVEFVLWVALISLAAGKFISILSLLFGAGIALSASRAEARGEGPFPFAFARFGWLWLFGMLHAYLLWHGDILVTYAFVGLAVYAARGWSPRWQFAAGAALVSTLALMIGALALAAHVFSDTIDWQAIFEEETGETVYAPLAQGWPGQWVFRAYCALVMQLVAIPLIAPWTAGMMLCGMALLRSGGFDSGRGSRLPRRRAALWLAVGGAITSAAWLVLALSRSEASVLLLGVLGIFAAIPFLALGYAHLAVAWAARDAAPGLLRRGLSAVGRMALSNYLAQSLLFGLVFYGHGLGLIGQLGLPETLAIAPATWVVQMAVSTWWLRRFAHGPMEWLWRSLAQGRRMPMRLVS